jgi:sulfite exporter TauE/SafE
LSETAYLAEAVALGISSGPACVVACGPVLLPCLVAEGRGPRDTVSVLARFLAGRFCGYLVFALAAWAIHWQLDRYPAARTAVFAGANLLLAVVLATYARHLQAGCAGGHCVRRTAAPAAAGLLAGLNVCPPFVAAAVRAAESPSLGNSLLFFFVFFLVTSVLFLPAALFGLFSRLAQAGAVARLTLYVLACYYGYLGLMALLRVSLHGA